MANEFQALCSAVFWIKLLFPALTVFLAMYWAQSIFNENARQRENRERRLAAADRLIAYTCETGDLTVNFLNSNKTTGLQVLITRSAHIKAYIKLFFPELNEVASNFGNALHEISDPLDRKYLKNYEALSEQYEKPGADQHGLSKKEYARRLINPNWLNIEHFEEDEILNMVTAILDGLIDIHRNIECKKR